MRRLSGLTIWCISSIEWTQLQKEAGARIFMAQIKGVRVIGLSGTFARVPAELDTDKFNFCPLLLLLGCARLREQHACANDRGTCSGHGTRRDATRHDATQRPFSAPCAARMHDSKMLELVAVLLLCKSHADLPSETMPTPTAQRKKKQSSKVV